MCSMIAIYPHNHRHKSKCSESERISVKNTQPVIEEEEKKLLSSCQKRNLFSLSENKQTKNTENCV